MGFQAGDSSLMLSNGTKIQLKSTFVSNGTLPVGSTWQMLVTFSAICCNFATENGAERLLRGRLRVMSM